MEYRCSVLGCSITSRDAVKLHKFPFDNQSLLPVWIMATKRSDWLPNVKSRMCEHHFSIDDYENGDKKNKLKSNACPMINASNNAIEYDETMTDSDTNDTSFASEEYYTDTDNLDVSPRTNLELSPRTCDLRYSDDDWIQCTSSDNNSNEATGFDDNLSLLSDTELNVDKNDIELDCVSLSSSVTSLENFSIINKCAVVLCNENVRNQFETLFFINFPKDNKELCDTWWKVCGRNEEFDFSFKICSIHFDPSDFTTLNIRRDGQLIKQTILKNNVVPTRYLLSHEYTKFIRKRKKCVEDKVEIENKSTEIEKCSVQNCSNKFSKDSNKTFSKFPLENQHVLQKVLNNIGLPDWQPLKTDRICSDHLKNDFVVNNGNILESNKYPVPLIMPKNSCDSNSVDQKNENCPMINERKNNENNFLLKNEPQQKSLETIKEKITIKEINMIPKSKNNGNDRDYVYLDTLSGDDVGEFLSFEKKYTPKHFKKKIPELLEKNHIKETPESIIYNQDLTECYGEMLPPNCDQECQLICYYTIPNHLRREIYKEFMLLHNVTDQNCMITQLVQLSMAKKRDGSFESCPSYHLIMNKELIKVCRKFFMNTLGITEQRLNAILKPVNYSWYSDRDTALKANQPKKVKVINETTVTTDFMKESLILLDKDYNLYEPESDSEVSLENVCVDEYERVLLYMKGIPRVLSSYQIPGELKKQFFETSISLEYMYKKYSENYLRKKISPPYTLRQFKKIYNQYMKTFLKMV